MCVSAASSFQKELVIILLRGRGADHVCFLRIPHREASVSCAACVCPGRRGGEVLELERKHMGEANSRQSPFFSVSHQGLSLRHSVSIASDSITMSHQET